MLGHAGCVPGILYPLGRHVLTFCGCEMGSLRPLSFPAKWASKGSCGDVHPPSFWARPGSFDFTGLLSARGTQPPLSTWPNPKGPQIEHHCFLFVQKVASWRGDTLKTRSEAWLFLSTRLPAFTILRDSSPSLPWKLLLHMYYIYKEYLVLLVSKTAYAHIQFTSLNPWKTKMGKYIFNGYSFITFS